MNVTDDRDKGFEEGLASRDSKIEIVAKQAADYERAKGQTVTEQLIPAHPDINCIYAHNDEMALGAVAALQGGRVQAGRRQDHHHRRHPGRGPGHRRRVGLGRHRVEPALRTARLQGAGRLLRHGAGVPVKTIISDKEYTQGQRGSRAAERVLTVLGHTEAGTARVASRPARPSDGARRDRERAP